MSDPMFSPSWYRVAQLRPRLRRHARLHRHHYRGKRWYVLQDGSSGRCHRLSPSAHYLIGLMNGVNSTQEIWKAAVDHWGDEAPTQDDTIRLLGLLHAADVLACDLTPDTDEMLRRSQRRDSKEWWQRFSSPLSQRFPLIDPDAFLERWLWLVRPLFSWPAAVVVGGILGAAILLAAAHWSELAEGSTLELLDPRNMLILCLVYPVIKGLHELGHGFATKAWGGAVHEMGIMLLVFFPVPYVDASASSVFPEKHKRMLVGAAGILVELLLAALALFVWLAVEPGLIRSVAFNVMAIGGLSTLLFNGNPLLRYDGYYVLSDAIEIPNLAGRSKEYLGFLVLHYLFGLKSTRYPVTTQGEAPWFFCYGIASFVYRLIVVFAIALMVAEKFFFVGVALAIFSLGSQLLIPLLRQLAALVSGPRFAEARGRSLAITAAGAAATAGFLLLLPMPFWTSAEGVVWLPDHSQVRAGEDGFVTQVLVEANSQVKRGDALISTHDPLLDAEVAMLEAQLREVGARYHSDRGVDLVRAQIAKDELETVQAALARARERVGEVTVRSPADGRFVLSRADDLAGRFVKQGELLAYVVAPESVRIRVVVPQSDVALVRERTEAVRVRLSSRFEHVELGSIERNTPAASRRLPSRTLGSQGGGPWPVDPNDPDGLETLEPVFQFDVALASATSPETIGERAYVRFEHDPEPLGLRSVRALRRLLLGRFGV